MSSLIPGWYQSVNVACVDVQNFKTTNIIMLKYESNLHYNRNILLTIIYVSGAAASFFGMTAPD